MSSGSNRLFLIENVSGQPEFRVRIQRDWASGESDGICVIADLPIQRHTVKEVKVTVWTHWPYGARQASWHETMFAITLWAEAEGATTRNLRMELAEKAFCNSIVQPYNWDGLPNTLGLGPVPNLDWAYGVSQATREWVVSVQF